MKNGKWLVWFVLLIGMVAIAASFYAKAENDPRIVTISAKRFEFNPNQITLKKGEPVKFQLTSQDVTHGFFMKALNIDAEIVPGKTTEFTITPQTSGRFTAICDHFCGAQHGNMRMTIVVEE
jgi:cytochrome c oxidase subunit 2